MEGKGKAISPVGTAPGSSEWEQVSGDVGQRGWGAKGLSLPILMEAQRHSDTSVPNTAMAAG